MTRSADMDEAEVMHRLRNYLGVVLGFSELLLDGFPAEDPRQADLVALRQAAEDALQLAVRLEDSRRMPK